MTSAVPPFLIFFLGAAFLPFINGHLRKAYIMLVPTLALLDLYYMTQQTSWAVNVFGFNVVLLHADRLSLVVGYIFGMIGWLAILYSLRVEEPGQLIFAFLYVGSSLGAVFAGDLFSLFAFWEVMAFTSVMLVFYDRSKRSVDAGFRYILFHVFGGTLLMAGIVIHYITTGSIDATMVEMGTTTLSKVAYVAMLLGVGLNTAFIGLHTWLPDSYPKSTIYGGVFMSVFTTKTGVYALARLFTYEFTENIHHVDNLIFPVAAMGTLMVVYGVVFALQQNDIRKLLSYHIISQVGYMVAGVGLGTAMGINGGIAHVFNHILYKSLLFMTMGAVMYSTGRRHLTELGGIWRKMPVTMVAAMVAAFSISGVPGFNGFVSKGMVIDAAAELGREALEAGHMAAAQGFQVLWLGMLLGSIGTFLSFLKLTYFTFFRPNEYGEEVPCKGDPPWPMQLAMSITAFLCVFYGLFPQYLYRWLPYDVAATGYDVIDYGIAHVSGTAQILAMTAFTFFVLNKYFEPHVMISYDLDYFYRLFGRFTLWSFNVPISGFGRWTEKVFFERIPYMIMWFTRNPYAALKIIWRAATGRDVSKDREAFPNIPLRMEVVSNTALMALLLFIAYILILLYAGGISRLGGGVL
ncbi:MAG: Na(+)/H(+) antiporter subunit D [Euryarchaeota archaeon]|nr:Na(+)/H(+) antiporter subunit D [Euryarchaeota archaeon]